MKYLLYSTHEFSRCHHKSHDLVGVSYGCDIYDVLEDIQQFAQDDMKGDGRFKNCSILADKPIRLNTMSLENRVPYDFYLTCVAYPNYPAKENLIEYYGIIETEE